jgi:hypothetical protein
MSATLGTCSQKESIVLGKTAFSLGTVEVELRHRDGLTLREVLNGLTPSVVRTFRWTDLWRSLLIDGLTKNLLPVAYARDVGSAIGVQSLRALTVPPGSYVVPRFKHSNT